MNEWPSYTVAELQREGLLLVEDGNHGEYRPRPNEFVEEGVPFIRAADMANGRVLFDGAGRINDEAFQRVRKGIGEPGDILFSHKGTVGKLARVPMDADPFVCSPQTTFWRVLDQSRLRRDYLYAFMRSRAFIQQWWIRKGETDMADYVSLTAQRQLRVTLPPIEEQCRIAEPLGALDDLIETNQHRIEVLDQMTQAIYREWFVHFRYPGREDGTLVDSSLGRIPEDWEVSTIGQVLELRYGKALKAADRKGGPVAVVGSSDVVGWHDEEIVSGPAIVVGRKGNVGNVTWVPGSCWPIDTTYYVDTELPLRYVAEQLRRAEFINTHAAVPGLSREQAYSLPFLLPPNVIMLTFSEISDTLGVEGQAFGEQIMQLVEIRDLLLPKLVTGQIDVSCLDPDTLVEPVA